MTDELSTTSEGELLITFRRVAGTKLRNKYILLKWICGNWTNPVENLNSVARLIFAAKQIPQLGSKSRGPQKTVVPTQDSW